MFDATDRPEPGTFSSSPQLTDFATILQEYLAHGNPIEARFQSCNPSAGEPWIPSETPAASPADSRTRETG